MIFLSKRGEDEYINLLASSRGASVTASQDFVFDDSREPIVLRGITNKVIKKCMQTDRPFYYMDSGYFGNRPSARNPNGWKWYHRLVPNDLQHDKILKRPNDRWRELGISIKSRMRGGRKILVVAPDEKACKFYNTTVEDWINSVKHQLATNTARPIVIRYRTPSMQARTRDPNTSFAAALADDVSSVVTFNSVAACEAIIAGVPVFVTAPCNAARPVANLDLAKIDDPWYPDKDLIYAWACHLAYGQFHIKELGNGRALDLLLENHG